jgi:hypothetical protein
MRKLPLRTLFHIPSALLKDSEAILQHPNNSLAFNNGFDRFDRKSWLIKFDTLKGLHPGTSFRVYHHGWCLMKWMHSLSTQNMFVLPTIISWQPIVTGHKLQHKLTQCWLRNARHRSLKNVLFSFD